MPSLAVDRLGDMALGYSVSSSSLNPGIRYAGRLVGDPASTLGQGETTLASGGGSQTYTNRWGDYATMTLDPDGCTFWFTSEIYNADGSDWHTRIGSFAYPSCTGGGGATAPADPTSLAATATSSTSVNLTWADNANNETGYTGERSTDGITYASLATLSANAGSYVDSSAVPSTSYWYRVKATNGTASSGYATTGPVTTPPAPLTPAAPTSLAAKAVSRSSINLGWTDNANNETAFKIERSTNSSAFTQIATVGANATSYSDTGLARNTTYSYRVRATNAAGDSAYSNTATARTKR
jgi:titin